MNIDCLIEDFNVNLKNLYSDFNGTYLFGSMVNNTQNKDSDVDLVLLFNKVDNSKKNNVYNLISDLMYKYDVFIDAKIMDSNMLKFNPFFHDEIKQNGIFYGAR